MKLTLSSRSDNDHGWLRMVNNIYNQRKKEKTSPISSPHPGRTENMFRVYQKSHPKAYASDSSHATPDTPQSHATLSVEANQSLDERVYMPTFDAKREKSRATSKNKIYEIKLDYSGGDLGERTSC